MGKGVQNSSTVCLFMTPKYENSKNCQREFQRAADLNKRIIPCLVGDENDDKWKPSNSLGLIIAGLTYINFRDNSDSSIQLKTRELIGIIKKQPSALPTELIRSPVKWFEPIRQKYLRDDTIKRIMNEEKCYPIEQSYINLAMVETKEQQEKEKKLKQRNQNMQEELNQPEPSREQKNDGILTTYEEVYGVKTSIEVKDIFQKCKDTTKRVLVLGRAGIGKSTFCQYITYRWARGELWPKYDLLVLILLRKLTSTRYPSVKTYSLVDLIEKEYFPFGDLTNQDRRHFKEQCDKGEVLWILDGYDEFAQNIPEQLKDAFDNVRMTQHHILTSRPYAIALSYDVKMEIIGFTNENIARYLEQFFNSNTDEIGQVSSESQQLLNLLKSSPSIWGIAHIPVNLELICSLWKNTDWSKTTALTITQLYSGITEWLCRRYLQKQKNISHEHMTKKAVHKQCYTEMVFLEQLAFKAIERNQVMLPPALLEEIEDESEFTLADHLQLLNIGILKSYDDTHVGNVVETSKQHYFVHLSFQEYFAARNLLKILQSSQKQVAIEFINYNKYNQRFHFVFVFASGLLAESDFKSSRDTFWKTVQGEPMDLCGLKHMKLTIECIDQLINTTVFPERTLYTKQICQWLKTCASQKQPTLQTCLAESLQRANSLLSTSIIHNTFIKLLETQHHRTKKNVLTFISKLTISNPSSELVTAIITALSDEHADVRSRACYALGKMGEMVTTSEVVTALLNALNDQDPAQDVCHAAKYVLKQMREKALDSCAD